MTSPRRDTASVQPDAARQRRSHQGPSQPADLVPPVRTCVLCRGRATRAALARVVAEGGQLVLDRAQRRPGRGAYVHAVTRQGAPAACARSAPPALFERALRTRLTPASVAAVVAEVRGLTAASIVSEVSPSVPPTPTNPSSLPTTSA